MHFYRCTDFADRGRLRRRPRASSPTSRASIRDEIAAILPAPAAATSSSTRSRSPSSAIRPSARRSRARAKSPDRLVDLYIESLNEAVSGAPPDVTFGVHMCRGNFKGHYLGAGGYESVAERFFAARASTTSSSNMTRRGPAISAAALRQGQGRRARAHQQQDAGAGETSPISSAAPRKRPEYIDLDRLAISPQCGFASTVAGNPITETDERAKLRLVVDAAEEIWH